MNRRPADLIPLFANARILVIGDLMLDKTIIGSVTRIAPEAPVPVVLVSQEQHFLGGASNAAANAATLGGNVILAGYVGNDGAADTIRQLCADRGISCAFVTGPEPTIQKVRVTSAGQQIVRVDYEEKRKTNDRSDLLSAVKTHLPVIDVILLSDYNKGTLTPDFVKTVLGLGKPVVVDPKPENLAWFSGATLLHPNHLAVEKATGKKLDTEESVTSAGKELGQKLNTNLLITRGAHGMSLIAKDGDVMHIPTQAREVYDVTGAGDSSIATIALALAVGGTLREAVILANQTAGIKVGKLGTATVTARELSREFDAGHTKIKTVDEITAITGTLRSKGKKIVFTNGFFDILHIGHARLFTHAKTLGDCLVLGINTDASIKRLKGEGRPLVPQSERAEILSAIEAVDYIVFFDSDTPLALVEKIKPDVLVKGGTMAVKDIVGNDLVTSYGGTVQVIPLTPSKNQLGMPGGIEE